MSREIELYRWHNGTVAGEVKLIVEVAALRLEDHNVGELCEDVWDDKDHEQVLSVDTHGAAQVLAAVPTRRRVEVPSRAWEIARGDFNARPRRHIPGKPIPPIPPIPPVILPISSAESSRAFSVASLTPESTRSSSISTSSGSTTAGSSLALLARIGRIAPTRVDVVTCTARAMPTAAAMAAAIFVVVFLIRAVTSLANGYAFQRIGLGITNDIRNLNNEDILSMDVLKDASAQAIYGARASNGVIMITSDDHPGLKAALKSVFNGVSWNRCHVHLQRNASAYVPKIAMRSAVARDIASILSAPNRDEARRLLDLAAWVWHSFDISVSEATLTFTASNWDTPPR